MKRFSLKKSLVILSLSLSNLFVLTVIWSHSFGGASYKLFSRADQSEKLEEEIKKQCESDFKKVLNGERTSFICVVKMKKKHEGASYELRTRFKVSKKGESLKITSISGRFANGEKHLTEAEFCSDCFEDREFQDSSAGDFTEFMKEVSVLAEEMSISAEQSTEVAFKNYHEKDRARALARLKQRNCEGVWDQASASFQEFEDPEERLECRLRQMDRQGSLIQAEEFYHKLLKKELWKLYGEGEEELLAKTLKSFNDPYRYSLSVQASAALLENYSRWKKGFDVLESLADKERFLAGISKDVKYLTHFMTAKQSEQDLYYLNQGFEGLYKTVNEVSLQIENARSKPASPGIDYDAVSKEVEGLF